MKHLEVLPELRWYSILLILITTHEGNRKPPGDLGIPDILLLPPNGKQHPNFTLMVSIPLPSNFIFAC